MSADSATGASRQCADLARCAVAATPDDLCAACSAAFDRDYEEHNMTEQPTCEYVGGCDQPVHSPGSRVCGGNPTTTVTKSGDAWGLGAWVDEPVEVVLAPWSGWPCPRCQSIAPGPQDCYCARMPTSASGEQGQGRSEPCQPDCTLPNWPHERPCQVQQFFDPAASGEGATP